MANHQVVVKGLCLLAWFLWAGDGKYRSLSINAVSVTSNYLNIISISEDRLTNVVRETLQAVFRARSFPSLAFLWKRSNVQRTWKDARDISGCQLVKGDIIWALILGDSDVKFQVSQMMYGEQTGRWCFLKSGLDFVCEGMNKKPSDYGDLVIYTSSGHMLVFLMSIASDRLPTHSLHKKKLGRFTLPNCIHPIPKYKTQYKKVWGYWQVKEPAVYYNDRDDEVYRQSKSSGKAAGYSAG